MILFTASGRAESEMNVPAIIKPHIRMFHSQGRSMRNFMFRITPSTLTVTVGADPCVRPVYIHVCGHISVIRA